MYSHSDEIAMGELARQLLESTELNQQTLAQLKAVIQYADWKYYVQDNPVFADVEYDNLFKKLKSIEENHPEWITLDSPTQRVAQVLDKQLPSVKHLVPMLSLENSYNAEDLIDWHRRCTEALPNERIQYVVEPKFDGASISIIYENNFLVRGATRGDGVEGEEITNNIKQIRSLPLMLPLDTANIQQLEIRGEVVIPKSTFKTLNEQRMKEGLSILANPRNAASGTLRMLDSGEVTKRGLVAYLYHVSNYSLHHDNQPIPQAFASHYDSLHWLYSMGVRTPIKDMQRFDHIEDVIAYCQQFEAKRDELPYEIDGMVVKVDNIHLQEELGMTAHHPRWAIAYKFAARQATSVLEQVQFQVGRTGSITPVAKITPVAIGGVTVSSVSLFNEEVVKSKDILIGDTVLVERAGDVIPYIVKSLPELRKGSEMAIVFPTQCPVCNSELVKPQGEAAWRCINWHCSAQVVERIIHFASKDAMDIRSLGEANVQKFYELEWLKDIASIYELDFTKIAQLKKFGTQSVKNLQDAIEKSKLQPLHRLIFGLGIRFVGSTTAKTLANAVSDLMELKDWSIEQLCTLEDVGPKVAESVFNFFLDTQNIEVLHRLSNAGLNFKSNKQNLQQTSGNLSGKTFLFTGTLSTLKRSDAEHIVEERGGKLLSSVSSKLNFLVVGTDAGSKLEKAKKIGTVTIMSEQDFITMIQEEAQGKI